MTALPATIATIVILTWSGIAFAQTGDATCAGLLAGFSHPIISCDHGAAMDAVGLWRPSTGRVSGSRTAPAESLRRGWRP
jgi:hydrogenase/urease accessory protein HupE